MIGHSMAISNLNVLLRDPMYDFCEYIPDVQGDTQ